MIVLYHGTYVDFDKPDLSKCDPCADFGPGFYLTPDYENACRFARYVAAQHLHGKATVICFEYDETLSSRLSSKRLDLPNGDWFDFVMANRLKLSLAPDHNLDHRYSIVKGLIADAKFVKLMKKYQSDPKGNRAEVLKSFQCQQYRKYQYSFHDDQAISCLKKKWSRICQ